MSDTEIEIQSRVSVFKFQTPQQVVSLRMHEHLATQIFY